VGGSAAIIVGIDAYVTQPLTSAVNDARLFAETLVDLGLVGSSDIRMLTAPSDNEDDLPTRKGILDALRPYYTGEESVDRLFVYYAGHGLLTFADAARALPRTALLPVDVRDLADDGAILIDLDSVLARLRFSGPAEQFFFIDACRDLDYEDSPDTTTALGWRRVPPGAERKQAILYAVPPLGKAQSEHGGLGVMTRHLVDAFCGRGIALDYSDDLRKYVVSPESVAAYVEKRVLETVGTVPLWQRSYILPRLDHREPKTGPIREIDQPGAAHLTLHVSPQDAEFATRVQLTQMDHSVCSWPPNSYGQPFAVKPRRYWLEAESDAGWVDPAPRRIDAREEHEATIEIRPRIGGPAAGPSAYGEPTVGTPVYGQPTVGPEAGPSEPDVVTVRETTESLPPTAPQGTIVAEALEPQSTVELQQIDPPYLSWATPQRLIQPVPPGAYRIRFRLGLEIFSEGEVDVRDRTVVTVTPTVGGSPLTQELIGPYWPLTQAVVSETIGPIQAGVQATALPIIGIKPFDTTHELFREFEGVVPRLDPHAFGMRPVSLVLAIDGNRWPLPASQVLRTIRATAESISGATEIPVAPPGTDVPAQRIALGVIEAPAHTFTIHVHSPYVGGVTLATASLHRRVTVIALTFRPDGSFDLSQNLLRIPGLDYDELVTNISYGRMLRDLQLGQRLYESSELVERSGGSQLLTDLLYAKWTDPILSCMAAFAWSDGGLPSGDLLATTARNLRRYFGDLPDTRIVQALAFAAEREQTLSDMLNTGELPVLARSAAELARYAQERGRDNHPVVALSRRVMPGQPWLMSWQIQASGAAAQQMATT
jgi:hypothetical protein